MTATRVLGVRFTPGERSAISLFAAGQGLTSVAFVRRLVLQTVACPPRTTKYGPAPAMSESTKYCLCSDPDYCLQHTTPEYRLLAVAYRKAHGARLPMGTP